MNTRTIAHTVKGVPTSDGAGVKLVRSIGHGVRVDPFLMLDEFFSDEPDDYIAGFPSHPHRGFETVTYMLDGHMLHEDHMGNRGNLTSGSVQWMTAGRGVIHSEMPQQSEGRMRGFQLWINLPAAEKMKPASYADIPAVDIPVAALEGGGTVKVIAGRFAAAETVVSGPINGDDGERLSTDPLYLDIDLPSGAALTLPVAPGHSAFAYVYEGSIEIGGDSLPPQHAGVLTSGDQLTMTGGIDGGRCLLLAGRPLGEPVAQYGPFVMNTREELEQAMRDYASGKLTEPAG